MQVPAEPFGVERAQPDPVPAPPPSDKLLRIRRLYIERLGGGEAADQIRDMIIAAVHRAGLFQITEDPDRADAIMRGSAEDLIYTETHDYREGINVRGAVSLGSSSRSSSSSRRSGGIYASSTIGQDEGARSSERRHEASVAVRIIDAEGDVIWSAVGESRGTKFRSASADVARQVAQQLVRDYQRAKRLRGTKTGQETSLPSSAVMKTPPNRPRSTAPQRDP